MSFDAGRCKALERAGYNLIAARYAESAAQRTALHAAILDAAQLAPGQRVLDLASGPGVLAAGAVLRVAGGWIVACDLAEQALAEGQRRARADAMDDLLFVGADAEQLTFADGSFQRVLCGLGLMFFPDPSRALAEVQRVLQADGRVVFSLWGSETNAPLVSCAIACLRRMLPAPKVPHLSPFRFGERARVEALLAQAGFADIGITSHWLDNSFASAQAYWQTFRDLAGGAAAGLARLPAAMLERLGDEVAQELAPWRTEAGYRLPSEVLIASARRV